MKWIPVRSMTCVHTHQTRPKIKGCDTPNHIENIVEKPMKIIERLRRLVEL
jgi:hypothetical protein